VSRTKRDPYPKTGKGSGRGDYTEEFRLKQVRGLVKNSIADHENREEVWQPKLKRSLKRERAKKERRNIKQELKTTQFK
jgi:hypothetical protein